MIAWFSQLLRRLGSLFRRGHADDDGADTELREVFFAELDDVTQTLERAFSIWRENNTDEAALKDLRRGFHTIKSSAHLVGEQPLGDFCRHFEQLAIRLMDKQAKVTPAIVVSVDQAVAVLPAFAKAIREGRAPPPQAVVLGNRVQRLLG
ncbi:MAG: Hpt domain-containing protein [Xanthomonadales bacterium]|nr:hypothetical protein [Xanthomonadales bacterium]MCC6592800.1 Hpt domain-containing protein [Xanthomonadales bacterium]